MLFYGFSVVALMTYILMIVEVLLEYLVMSTHRYLVITHLDGTNQVRLIGNNIKSPFRLLQNELVISS